MGMRPLTHLLPSALVLFVVLSACKDKSKDNNKEDEEEEEEKEKPSDPVRVALGDCAGP